MKKTLLLLSLLGAGIFLSGCGMGAHDYFVRGSSELEEYKCDESINDFKMAADMELEDEGDWYPIYMLGLGISRYYCNDIDGSLNAFGAIDQYTVLRSNRDDLEKGFEFLKSKGERTYELTEREETLLHYYLGMINFKKGNYEDAMVEFKKVDYIADGNYSKLPLIALMRGLTYEKLNDESNAFVAYKKVAEQNPDSPVGYLLSYRMENTDGNKLYWETELKNKFNIDVKNLVSQGKEFITIIECKNGLDSEYKFALNYNNYNSRAYLFDVVDPDFDFGDFAAGVLKEVGSKVARDLIKNIAANVLPGGGLIAGLFLGGDKAEQRAWVNLPQLFVVDVSYIPEGSYDLNIEYYEDQDLEKEKSLNVDTRDNIIFVTNF